MDDLASEETLETLEKLELTDESIAVIEGLGEDGGESALELLDSLAELEEVVSELLHLDVHDVVVDEHKGLDGLSEFSLNGHNGSAHGSTLGVTNLDLLQLVELLDGLGELHNVLAPLSEGIKADKEGARSDLPGVLGLGLVVVVGDLELGAEVPASGELAVSITWVFVLDCTENLVTVDLLAALEDDGVANLSDEDQEACWGVVVLRVGPDEEDGVHDGDEELRDFSKVERGVDELVEVLLKGLEVLVVLISLDSGNMDFLLEFAEGASLSGFVLLEELQNFLDAFTRKLLADRVQVLTLVLPEGDLGEGIWVLGLLESLLWVFPELSLDLLGPVADSGLQDSSFVLG